MGSRTRRLTRQFRRHDHVCEREDASSAAHVLLHDFHGRRRFEVEAARVEDDALSDQAHARMGFVTPGEVDQARLFAGSPAHMPDEGIILLEQVFADDGLDDAPCC